jgi:hypothetical protein
MGFSTYNNPLTPDGSPGAGGWALLRTDQGVDYGPPTANAPVRAIGTGVITYSRTTTGWPGGAYIVYRLEDGDAQGQYIYVSEHLTNLLPEGTRVLGGDTIALAQPGYPYTEWGWSSAPGNTDAPFSSLAKGQILTAGGMAFARFMRKLGAPTLEDPGSGAWNMGGTGPPYTGGAVGADSGGAGQSTQSTTPSDTSGALVYANKVAAGELEDPTDPRDNLRSHLSS